MEQTAHERKRRLLKVTCIALAIILMLFIATAVSLIVHKLGSNSAVTVENGLSAYELAVKYGFEGSIQDWLDSLNGRSGYDIAVENGYQGTEEDWANALKQMTASPVQGIKSASFNESGELLLTLTDETVLNAGKAIGENGKDGISITDVEIKGFLDV